MAGLFADYNPKTLQDVLGQQAQSATAQSSDAYNQSRKQLVSQQAASGRLQSGVADYPLTDLDTEKAQSLSGIQDNLVNSLAGISGEDFTNSQDFYRNLQLANQIGNLNKPSTLDEIFGTIGGIGQGAAAGSSFGPYGAVAGGVIGGASGAYNSSRS